MVTDAQIGVTPEGGEQKMRGAPAPSGRTAAAFNRFGPDRPPRWMGVPQP
jgi:hypothetical protein